MNLGNATLRSVSYNRPRLSHPPSAQSISASDDYKSFSDYASDASSVDDRTTVIRWHTPPSQHRTPGQENPQSEATLPIKPTRAERDGYVLPLGVRFNEASVSEKVNITSVVSTKPAESDTSPPTPGTDDTPYIRYAIEQLTRDPEGSPSRRPGSASSSETYPVARIIPDEGLGYMKQEFNPEPSAHSDEERTEWLDEPDLYIPVNRPEGSYRHPEIDFVPTILRSIWLGLLILFCLIIMGALVFCFIWSTEHNGLWDYNAKSGSQYFLFGYLPQLVAALLLLWLLCVETAVFRVMPFILMASEDTKLRSKALFVDMLPTNFLLPRLDLFQTSHALIASCLSGFWLAVFTIPLMSSTFHVRLVEINGVATWRWIVVQPVLWAILGLYAIITVSLLALLFFFTGRRTGLKWDPVSLADIIVLLQRSNSVGEFAGTETLSSLQAFREKLRLRTDRLGYWRTTNSDEVFYAIGEEGAETRRFSVRQGKVTERLPDQRFADRTGYDLEGQHPLTSVTNESLRGKIFSPSVRYRTVPWFLRDTYVVAWIVIALVLLLAFLIVSFLHHKIQHGFRPLVSANQTSLGFSPADFLYSFLPSFLGTLLFLFWTSIDASFRSLQPFSALANPRGSPADETLLLDYPSLLPLECTVRAVLAGHWKVAYISFLSILSLVIPVLAGGVFWLEYFPSDANIRVSARLVGFYVLTTLLVLYSLGYLFIWPRWKRYLPHGIHTLAEIISFFYQSPLLGDVAFRDPRSKTDLVTRLLSPPPGEKEQGRFAFGVYRGRDGGREHLGIDRVERRYGADMLVVTGRM